MNHERSGEEWIRSALAYLTCQAKAYADAAAVMRQHLMDSTLWRSAAELERDAEAQRELDRRRGVPPPLSPEELKLLERPRAQLVEELLCDPRFTDGRLLSHLPRRKLARMVNECRERNAADSADWRCA